MGGQVLQLLPDDSRLGVQPPSAGVRPEVGDFAPSKEEEKRDGILRARNEDEAIIERSFAKALLRPNRINS